MDRVTAFSLRSRDGGRSLPGYGLAPASGAVGSLIAVQKVAGTTTQVKRLANEYAAAGFSTFVLDLLWRAAGAVTPPTAAAESTKDRSAVQEAARKVDSAAAVAEIGEAVESATAYNRPHANVGVIAFGWACQFAVEAADRHPVHALALYYPSGLQQWIDKAVKLRIPLMFHLGQADEHLSAQARRTARLALAERDDAEFYVYRGASHGFADSDRSEYHAAFERLARGRTADFLTRCLGGR